GIEPGSYVVAAMSAATNTVFPTTVTPTPMTLKRPSQMVPWWVGDPCQPAMTAPAVVELTSPAYRISPKVEYDPDQLGSCMRPGRSRWWTPVAAICRLQSPASPDRRGSTVSGDSPLPMRSALMPLTTPA